MTVRMTTFYAGAIDAGLRPIHLLPSSDRCSAGTWEDHIVSTSEQAVELLEDGQNMGFLLAGKDGCHPNPIGVWALVINSRQALERYGEDPFTVMLAWGHSDKRILLGCLPDASVPRKGRAVKNSHEVKLGGILPTLGSVHPEGGVIEAYVRDPVSRRWLPWMGLPIDWESIAVVDPSPYAPSTVLLIPLDEHRARQAVTRVPSEWVFWHEDVPADWNRQHYTSAKGNQSSRKIRAEGFVRNRIRSRIVSRSGDGGRKTLLTMAIHLVKYMCLPDETVLSLLLEPVHGMGVAWNDLCVDARTNQPMPWSVEELQAAIAAAQEYLPPYGVEEFKRFRTLREGIERLQAFRKLLSVLPAPSDGSPSMKAQDLYETFLEMCNLDKRDITYRRFSMVIQSGIETGYLKLKNIRRTKKKLRYYQGVSPVLIDFALEQSAEVEERVA